MLTTVPISLFTQYFDFKTQLIEKILFILFSLIPHVVLIAILSLRGTTSVGRLEVENRSIAHSNIADLEALKSELTRFMTKNKPYLRQDLSLQTLANLIGWSRSQLSMVINRGFGKKFYDYVNEYRLWAVIEKLNNGVHDEYSLDFIVAECGFKNYVSFYRIFKRVKKKSPKDYLKQLKKP